MRLAILSMGLTTIVLSTYAVVFTLSSNNDKQDGVTILIDGQETTGYSVDMDPKTGKIHSLQAGKENDVVDKFQLRFASGDVVNVCHSGLPGTSAHIKFLKFHI